MALRSMTGYGRGSAVWQGRRITVELASVNRKQLDIHLKLARELALLEPQLCEAVSRVVSRGRLSGEVTLDYQGRERSMTVELNMPLARNAVRVLREAAAELDLHDDLSAGLLLHLPDALAFREERLDTEQALPVVLKAMEQALRRLDAMRRKEGAALQAALREQLAAMAGRARAIRDLAPKAAERYRGELIRRIERARLQDDDLEQRIVKEVALFAERSDIAEELTRLGSHLKQMEGLLRAARPSGREMDFLCQEILREINTIASKANDSDIVRHVVSFKADLERYREQVQNIE